MKDMSVQGNNKGGDDEDEDITGIGPLLFMYTSFLQFSLIILPMCVVFTTNLAHTLTLPLHFYMFQLSLSLGFFFFSSSDVFILDLSLLFFLGTTDI
jgi:hypothetical protein